MHAYCAGWTGVHMVGIHTNTVWLDSPNTTTCWLDWPQFASGGLDRLVLDQIKGS